MTTSNFLDWIPKYCMNGVPSIFSFPVQLYQLNICFLLRMMSFWPSLVILLLFFFPHLAPCPLVLFLMQLLFLWVIYMPSCSIVINCNRHARAKGIFLLVFFRSSCGRNCWNQNATVLSIWGRSQHSLQDGIYQRRWSAIFNSSIKQWAMSWCHFRLLSWLSLEGWVCFRPSWLRNSGLKGTEDVKYSCMVSDPIFENATISSLSPSLLMWFCFWIFLFSCFVSGTSVILFKSTSHC